MFIKKPLLAANVNHVSLLDFESGFLATPKIDGIRCIVTHDSAFGTVVSRKFKRIPNPLIVSVLSAFRNKELDFDGEIVCSGGFQRTDSVVMSRSYNSVPFTYVIFDCLGSQGGIYLERLSNLDGLGFPKCVQILRPVKIYSLKEFRKYETECLKSGYEGVMLRRPFGRYKFGRSTLNEGILLKVKRWKDAEAIIEGFEPWYANTNASKRDELGYLKKSHAKAGKIRRSKLGAFVVRDAKSGKVFTVGSGLNDAQRANYWRSRHELAGLVIKYKFVPHGVKDLPRHPIFVGFRDLNF